MPISRQRSPTLRGLARRRRHIEQVGLTAAVPTSAQAPTPARPRCRDVPRGDPAPGHTAPTRARRPRDHLRVPAWDRQHRDHPRGPRAASTHDSRRPDPPRLSPQLVSAPDGGAWDPQPAPQAPPPVPHSTVPTRTTRILRPSRDPAKCLQPSTHAVLTRPQRVVAIAIARSARARARKQSWRGGQPTPQIGRLRRAARIARSLAGAADLILSKRSRISPRIGQALARDRRSG